MNLTQERFVELWSRNGGQHADTVYADLARRYGEPGRHYHTLRHVRRCLRYFDLACHAIERRDVVELALWCHDVIYVPGDQDNEQCSVDWVQRWAGDRFVMCERICEAILATRHTRAPVEPDSRFACDIDLAALGASRRRFQEDGMRLRAERPDLDDHAYAVQESKILRGLLARPRIYLTDYFHSRCEARARGNIAWRLGGQGLE
ncbi:hypothetical protein LMG28688_06340 [Paraburkholderia caffeinitolerans]|uniref:Metal-dependent HD superfamily phosphohydrolase n=1 Tax=Paraburkholderia caffeinitolerans TaxID=1723730 RepID=A0A6J5GWY3_9BURK|nr:hypothetical protein [Paraburkholderia caffeinitolerans]CAB3806346.1 hypothetical protein LMG28688_06340 [Paraburkholderia caffeinitolerans]